jgi:hypothetical protein
MVSRDGPLDGRLPRCDLVPGAALLVVQELLRTRPLGTSLNQWLSYIETGLRAPWTKHPWPKPTTLLQRHQLYSSARSPSHQCHTSMLAALGAPFTGTRPAVGTINRCGRGLGCPDAATDVPFEGPLRKVSVNA